MWLVVGWSLEQAIGSAMQPGVPGRPQQACDAQSDKWGWRERWEPSECGGLEARRLVEGTEVGGDTAPAVRPREEASARGKRRIRTDVLPADNM